MTALYQLEGIKFSYPVKKEIKLTLDITQLDILSNTVTALLGSNGAGKSTLLKVLSFLEIPQQGNIIFLGATINETNLLTLRRRVVLVAQKPYLLTGSVLDNVLQGLKFRRIPKKIALNRANEAIVKVGIQALADRHIADLSGGEVQKVAMARALVLDPEVLLLDEPFTHLDNSSIVDLKRVIENYANQPGKSVIFSTHQQSDVSELASEVIKLRSGSIDDY